jgi:hypothetical protein
MQGILQRLLDHGQRQILAISGPAPEHINDNVLEGEEGSISQITLICQSVEAWTWASRIRIALDIRMIFCVFR